MYIFGGQDIHTKILADTYQFDLETLTWKYIKCTGTIPVSKRNHAASIYKDRMYIFGGFGGFSRIRSRQLCYLDLLTNIWHEIKYTGQLPPPLCGQKDVIQDGVMYVFGGFYGRHSDDFRALDLKSGVWKKMKKRGDHPSMRCDHTAVLYDHKMVIFGGEDYYLLNDTIVYHIPRKPGLDTGLLEFVYKREQFADVYFEFL